eukprot:GHVS01072293.1.p1 GENE.GHVS01072293.1~~GHVS01072293.1.p1  ORF type:complete len:187 (-),score=28.91 GHVS01072293.1:63-623(-)
MKIARRGPLSRPLSAFFDSMGNQFAPQEWRYIKGQSTSTDQAMLRRFMRLWTMKEAFIKAMGTGLYVEPQRLQCGAVDSESPTMQMDGTIAESFRFHFIEVESSMPVGGRFVMCVCVGLDDSKAIEQYAAMIPPSKRGDPHSLSKLGHHNVIVQQLELRSFLESTTTASTTTTTSNENSELVTGRN